MTLRELSVGYRDSEHAIRQRIMELEAAARTESDPDKARALRLRESELTPMLREMRELARHTAHYYDRRIARNAKYTI